MISAVVIASFLCAMTPDGNSVVLSRADGEEYKNITCAWKALRDGSPAASGTFALGGFMRGRTAITNSLPRIFNELSMRHGELAIEVRFFSRDGEGVKKDLFRNQFELPRGLPPRGLDLCDVPPTVTVGDNAWTFTCKGVSYSFDRRTGAMRSARTGSWSSSDWLAEPLVPEVRLASAPDSALSLNPRLVSFDDPEVDGGEARFSTAVRWEGKRGGYLTVATWRVRGDGVVTCRVAIRSDADAAEVPLSRVGFSCVLSPRDEPLVQFYGCDENGNAPQRRKATPTDFATRRGVRALAFDDGGTCLSFVTAALPFVASVSSNAQSDVKNVSVGIYADETAATRERVFAFAIFPEKRLAAVTLPAEELPAVSPNAALERVEIKNTEKEKR